MLSSPSLVPLSISTLGVPRMGPRRELKKALESYWAGQSREKELLDAAAALRAASWARQKACGVHILPSNDFSLYDHVLDISVMVGAIPELYGWKGGPVTLETYFALARGTRNKSQHESGGPESHGTVPAQDMTKWFDTNYHYTVPDFVPDQVFRLSSRKPLEAYQESQALGYTTRPVLLGPLTYLKLGRAASATQRFNALSLLPRLLPVYVDCLKQLAQLGVEWVQMDEPCLVMDSDAETQKALQTIYRTFAQEVPQLKIMLTTYFGSVEDQIHTILDLPLAGLHVDLVRAPEQCDLVFSKAPRDLVLSLGIIDGRNVWRSDLSAIYARLSPLLKQRDPLTLQLAPSCSLLHVPVDLQQETALDSDVKKWLAFGVQKMEELALLRKALLGSAAEAQDLFKASDGAREARKTSLKVHRSEVMKQVQEIRPDMKKRAHPFVERARVQQARFNLPLFPTTTIGSFPQTKNIRQARSDHAKGLLGDGAYEEFLRQETAQAIAWQESIGLDVLVHGEFERNDMVQYFGEQLSGFVFTQHGWVQSYGSRCVRPPIIFGDVARSQPMTVQWWTYAQSLTSRPVKAMLTGPVTILNWSFVRDDVPRETVCKQIALALREEVLDLEAAGAAMIQVDEAALREGLPLRQKDWAAYLKWAVESFCLCVAGVKDETQIHTHMCYSDFNTIMEAIIAMDADVISIETSRSRQDLLEVFKTHRYPNLIGPGVYDIHSPRIPSTEEIVIHLQKAQEFLAPTQIWVNPDCGLKTRSWEDVRPALTHMVRAAQALRGSSFV